MKTSFKRFAALALAAIMVLGTMNLSAYADPTGNVTRDTQLVVSGLDNGDVAHFYRVIEWQMAVGENPGGWIYTSAFAPMSTASPAVTVTDIIGKSPDGHDWGLTADIAGELAQLVQSGSIAEYKSVPAANNKAILNSTVAGEDLPAGMYMVIITPSDPDVVYNPVFVSVDYARNASESWEVAINESSYQDNAATKKSKVEIKKSASTTEDSSYQDMKWNTTRIGESVDYAVTATIPGFGTAFDTPRFELSDKLTYLELVKENGTYVKPRVELPAGLTEGNQYTITVGSDGQSYKIVFTPEYLKTVKVPTDVKVTYTALVTTDAPYNVNVETNEVSLEFTHDPTNNDDFSVKKDTTQHYTFTIDASNMYSLGRGIGKSTSELIKVGRDSSGKPITEMRTSSQISTAEFEEGPLEGAHFKLYTDEACTKEYQPLKKDGTEDAKLDIVSDGYGRIQIKGLDAGTYWLKEYSAPEGFIKDQGKHKIEIEAGFREDEVTEYYYNEEWYESKAKAEEAVRTKNSGMTEAELTAEINKKVKSYTYKTEVIDWYRIYFDGKNNEVAKHTFMHPSNTIAVSWIASSAVELPSSIPNTQGIELPSTGGIGTTLFYAGGAVLVLLAGVLLVSKRRIA